MNDRVMPIGRVFGMSGDKREGRWAKKYAKPATISYIKQTERGYEFGAVGHNISDMVWMGSVPLLFLKAVNVVGTQGMNCFRALVATPRRSEPPLGVVLAHSDYGLVGMFNPNLVPQDGRWMEAARPTEGKAQFLGQMSGHEPFLSDINIREVPGWEHGSDYGFESTSGLVLACGASGSPIVQEDRFVGITKCMNWKQPHLGGCIYPERLLDEHDELMNRAIFNLETVAKRKIDKGDAIRFLDRISSPKSEFGDILQIYRNSFPPKEEKEWKEMMRDY